MNKQLKIITLLSLTLLVSFTSCILIFKGLGNNNSQKIDIKENSQNNIKYQLPKISSVNQNTTQSNSNKNTPDNKQDLSNNLKSSNVPSPLKNKEPDKTVTNSTPNTEPVEEVSLEISQVGLFTIPIIQNDTAFSVLIRASQQYNFRVKYTDYSKLGMFINCINNLCNHNNYYWFLYYNGTSSSLGASSLNIKNGDKILWRFEK